MIHLFLLWQTAIAFLSLALFVVSTLFGVDPRDAANGIATFYLFIGGLLSAGMITTIVLSLLDRKKGRELRVWAFFALAFGIATAFIGIVATPDFSGVGDQVVTVLLAGVGVAFLITFLVPRALVPKATAKLFANATAALSLGTAASWIALNLGFRSGGLEVAVAAIVMIIATVVAFAIMPRPTLSTPAS